MYFLYQAHIVKQHEPKTSEKSLYQKKLYALHGLAREGVRHSLVCVMSGLVAEAAYIRNRGVFNSSMTSAQASLLPV